METVETIWMGKRPRPNAPVKWRRFDEWIAVLPQELRGPYGDAMSARRVAFLRERDGVDCAVVKQRGNYYVLDVRAVSPNRVAKRRENLAIRFGTAYIPVQGYGYYNPWNLTKKVKTFSGFLRDSASRAGRGTVAGARTTLRVSRRAARPALRGIRTGTVATARATARGTVTKGKTAARKARAVAGFAAAGTAVEGRATVRGAKAVARWTGARRTGVGAWRAERAIRAEARAPIEAEREREKLRREQVRLGHLQTLEEMRAEREKVKEAVALAREERVAAEAGRRQAERAAKLQPYRAAFQRISGYGQRFGEAGVAFGGEAMGEPTYLQPVPLPERPPVRYTTPPAQPMVPQAPPPLPAVHPSAVVQGQVANLMGDIYGRPRKVRPRPTRRKQSRRKRKK